jgi:L-fuconolactonase
MITRRQFLGRSSQTIAAAGSVGLLRAVGASGASPAETPSFPIIDTHQHLWDLKKVRLAWLATAGPLNRSYVVKDYLEATAGLGIAKAVYMEVAADADCKLAEAEYVLELCRQGNGPTVAAVIGGCLSEESFKPYITRFKGNSFVKGVRQLVQSGPNGQCLYQEKRFLANIRLLGDLGMRFDLCQPPADLPRAIQLVDACPATQFILDHCGNGDPNWFDVPGKGSSADSKAASAVASDAAARRQAAEQWRKDIAALAKRPNVVCKISGVISQAPKDRWTPDLLAPIVHHCLDAFGPDRVVFASDWPVCTRVATLRQWVDALRHIVRNRPAEQHRKLFHDNAVRIYGL